MGKNINLSLVLTLGCLTGLAVGQESPFQLPKVIEKKPIKENGASNRMRDLELVIKTRRLLADDKDLGPLNIGVSVRDGILYLWGPVPDSKKIQEALNRVSKVKMIFEVKNEMYLGVSDDVPPPLFFQSETPSIKTP